MADLHNAILALHSNVATINGNDQSDIVATDENGNNITIDWTQVNAWTDPDQYKHDRKEAYPAISEQLDMLWHSIDSGTLDKTSDFYTTLKQVKDDNPKPSE